MLRTISIQTGEFVGVTPKEEKTGCGKDLQKRKG